MGSHCPTGITRGICSVFFLLFSSFFFFFFNLELEGKVDSSLLGKANQKMLVTMNPISQKHESKTDLRETEGES